MNELVSFTSRRTVIFFATILVVSLLLIAVNLIFKQSSGDIRFQVTAFSSEINGQMSMKYRLNMHNAYGVMVIGIRESGSERVLTSSRNCGGMLSRFTDGRVFSDSWSGSKSSIESGDLSVQQKGVFEPLLTAGQEVSIRLNEKKIIGQWVSSSNDSQLYVKFIKCDD